MKKILLSSLLALAVAAPLAHADDDPFPGTIAFTYADKEPESLGDYMGCFDKAHYFAGIRLTDPGFVGMKVVGIKVPFLHADPCKDVTAWIGTSKFEEEPEICNEPAEIVDNTITHRFANPYTITDGNTLVGYGLTVEELNDLNLCPIPMGMAAGSALVRVDMEGSSDWMDYSSFASCVMTVYLEGTLPADCLSVLRVEGDPIVLKDQPHTVAVTVSNNGSTAVTSLDYTFSFPGGPVWTKTYTPEQPIEPVLGGETTLQLPVDALSMPYQYDCTVSIDKVNGVANNAKERQGSYMLSVLDYLPAHRALMEEGTGTWCGWCPRGWIAMREMSLRHPEFIGVAYHNQDPMQVTYELPFDLSGYPGASLDRDGSCDPYYGYDNGTSFGIEADYEAACQAPTLADLSLTTAWADEAKTDLVATATAKFALPVDGKDYRIGYLLVGSGYCHADDTNWWQHNYYAGRTGYTGLEEELCAMPEYIKDIVFDDVAIDVDAMRGVEKSLPATMEQGKEYTHAYHFFNTATITSQTDFELIEDKDNLSVVAFIVDGKGRVFNAAKSSPSQNAINETLAEGGQAAPVYYDPQGRRVERPAHGIYVKVQGGHASKVVM